jgi:glutamyl/glutaminyl-tRNA synthetase
LDDNFLEDEPYQYNIEILNELNPEYIEKNEINSVYDIISSYDNLKKLIEIYPRQREIYNLFRTSDEGNILLMGKRIQLLTDIVNLKKLPISREEMDEINKKSIDELVKNLEEIKKIDELGKSKSEPNIFNKLPEDIIEATKPYVGGDKEEYKKKYMKYKKKYLELKENLM